MIEISCPYYNGRIILKIVYCFREVNKNRQQDFDYSDYIKDGTILIKRKKNNIRKFGVIN